MEHSEQPMGRKRTSVYLEFVRAGSGGIGVNEVSRRCCLEPSVVVEHIEALQSDGFIEALTLGGEMRWRTTTRRR